MVGDARGLVRWWLRRVASREEGSRAVAGVLGVEAWWRGLISGLLICPFPSGFARSHPGEWVGSGGGRSRGG